jgi:hypothetical protein
VIENWLPKAEISCRYEKVFGVASDAPRMPIRIGAKVLVLRYGSFSMTAERIAEGLKFWALEGDEPQQRGLSSGHHEFGPTTPGLDYDRSLS